MQVSLRKAPPPDTRRDDPASHDRGFLQFSAFFQSHGEVQVERPWLIRFFAVLTLAPAILATRRLGLKTDFAEFLPENKASVVEMLGYASLTMSMNQAIATFGLAAAAGEVSCLLAAVLVMPAALVWAETEKIGTRSDHARHRVIFP